VQVLEGDLNGTDGPASVFIDIIGLPFTPLSFAGVARRAAYRSAMYNAAVTHPYHGYPAPYIRPPIIHRRHGAGIIRVHHALTGGMAGFYVFGNRARSIREARVALGQDGEVTAQEPECLRRGAALDPDIWRR
jgi:hypothetical protein